MRHCDTTFDCKLLPMIHQTRSKGAVMDEHLRYDKLVDEVLSRCGTIYWIDALQ